jgi:hypothetical protein
MLEKYIFYPERIGVYACFQFKIPNGATVNITPSGVESVPAIKPRSCFATDAVTDDKTTFHRVVMVRTVHK